MRNGNYFRLSVKKVLFIGVKILLNNYFLIYKLEDYRVIFLNLIFFTVF